MKCLLKVAAGELWVEKALSDKLLSTSRVALTTRERQLAGLLTQGLKNKEVAYSLGIAEGTVKVYLSRLFQKLGVKDRFELALFAMEHISVINQVGDSGSITTARNDQSSAPEGIASRLPRSLGKPAPFFTCQPCCLSWPLAFNRGRRSKLAVGRAANRAGGTISHSINSLIAVASKPIESRRSRRGPSACDTVLVLQSKAANQFLTNRPADHFYKVYLSFCWRRRASMR